MAISGVGQSYYQNNVATTKSTKSVNSTGETGNTKELSEAEEMAIFKKEFYAEIDKIPRNRTITNVAINISEEAFKNMKDDPEYREKILSALKRDLTSSFAPLEASMVLTVELLLKIIGAIHGLVLIINRNFMLVHKTVFIKRQATRKIDKKSFWKNIWKNGRRLKNSSRKC